MVQRIDGGEPRPLTLGPGKPVSQTWSPDGTQLAAAVAIDGEYFVQLYPAFFGGEPTLTRKLDARTRKALLLLPELYGDVKILAVAARKLPALKPLQAALATLRALARACPIPLSFDLAELRGYHYHSGVVFDAYCDGVAGPVARGGRYDEVGRAFGRPRAATGFSIELRDLAAAMPRGKKRK